MDGEVLYTARTTRSKHVAGKAGHRPAAMLLHICTLPYRLPRIWRRYQRSIDC